MARKSWLLAVAVALLPAFCGAQGVGQKPYRIPLEGSPSTGPLDAPVTIVEFVDYQSEACRSAASALGKVLEARQGKIRLAIKYLPGASLDAHLAAKAALAAGAQGKFREMHERLLAPGATLDRDGLVRAAKGVGLDRQRFEAALDGTRHLEQVEQDKALAAALGVKEAPAFFVNGRRLAGVADLQAAVDGELAGAKP
jgi:protein-disulfide isomerase